MGNGTAQRRAPNGGVLMNNAKTVIESLWFTHPITLIGAPVRTARGTTPGTQHHVHASINVEARTVPTEAGEETLAAATVCYSVDAPLAAPGWMVQLPPEMGLGAAPREVITARRAISGNQFTPDHIEVTLR